MKRGFTIIVIAIFFIFLFFDSISSSDITYTPTTDKVCKGKTCTLTIYSGTRNVFEDGEWKRMEDARSLKDKGFRVIYLENDKFHKIEVVDFNYSSITFNFSYDKNSKNKDKFKHKIKDKELDSKYRIISKKMNESFDLKVKEDKKKTVIYYGNPFGKEFHFGENSTVLILEWDSVLEDARVEKDNNSTNFGNDDLKVNSNDRSYIKFNISNSVVPSGKFINSVILGLKATVRGSDSPAIYHCYNKTWKENQITWIDQPCGIYFNDSSLCNLTYESNSSYAIWFQNFSITNMFKKDYENGDVEFSMVLNASLGSTASAYYSSEDAADKPYKLHINYSEYLESLQITSPTNLSFFNDNVSMSLTFTVVNNTNLDTCLFTLDDFASNTTIPDCQNTVFNQSEGNYVLRIWINDSKNNVIQNSTNLTIDITDPVTENISVSTSSGSKTVTFSFNASDTHLDSCWYSVFNSSGGVDPSTTENTSVTCNSDGNSVTVSNFATYNLTIYANDSAGNENSTTESFTTSQAVVETPTGGGGGGTNFVETVALIKHDNDSRLYSVLDRAKLYRAISTFCENITLFGKCNLDNGQLINLQENLDMEFDLSLELETLRLWMEQFNNNLVENVKVSSIQVSRYNLLAAILEITGEGFQVNPKRIDTFFLIISKDSFDYTITANRVISDIQIVEGDLKFSVEKTGPTTAKLTYKLPTFPPDFNSKVIIGRINYIDEEGNSIFQDVRIRAIYLLDKGFIIGFVLLTIGSILYYFNRKKIRKRLRQLRR